MSCKVEKSELSGEIICPPNKSYTHRAVFMGSLSEQSTIRNILDSADTKATVDACSAFGAQIKKDGSTITIINPVTFGGNRSIDVKNSGTTIRIAAGVAALSSSITTLSGDESIQKRPMQPILDALETMGAKCTSTDGKPPITVQGKISGGEVLIPGNISSQFITSLFICAPLTDNGVTVNIEGNLVSKPYLEATISTMKKFGVQVKTINEYQKYRIEPQQYEDTEFTVPPDFSSLALLLAAAVLVGKDMKIKALQNDLPQGDKAFLEMLEKLGVTVNIEGDFITINSPEKLNGGVFDLANTPDLLPPLAIMVLKCQNPLEITNVKHARYKETDRIAIVSRELAKCGIVVDEKEDGMKLELGESVQSAEFDSEKDHRLFMAFSIAGMYIGNCTVSDPESVAVSYPEYVSEMQNIGANLTI